MVAKQKSWKRRVNLNGTFYIFVLFGLAIANVVYTVVYFGYDERAIAAEKNISDSINGTELAALRDEIWQYATLDYKFFKWAVPSTYLQFYACYGQLMIIVGLCLDGGQSVYARFFKTKVLQVNMQLLICV